MSDRHIALTKRVVAKTSDGAGGFSESNTDTTIYGYIVELSAREQEINKRLGTDVNARLFTTTEFADRDRVLWGTVVYEVVHGFNQFHRFYELKRL